MLTQVPQPIPALAYASEKFLAEAGLWYDAIMPILAKHAYPKGRLVAAQVDNEMAYFFCVNAYASDFSPSAIARYRLRLQERYGEIGTLNSRLRQPVSELQCHRSASPFRSDREHRHPVLRGLD